MTKNPSNRFDSIGKRDLGSPPKRSRQSKSFLAAEAITADGNAEEWRLCELDAGLAEIDAGQTVSHERIAKWLNSWGKPGEIKAPR